jgi:hypothetical protein
MTLTERGKFSIYGFLFGLFLILLCIIFCLAASSKNGLYIAGTVLYSIELLIDMIMIMIFIHLCPNEAMTKESDAKEEKAHRRKMNRQNQIERQRELAHKKEINRQNQLRRQNEHKAAQENEGAVAKRELQQLDAQRLNDLYNSNEYYVEIGDSSGAGFL